MLPRPIFIYLKIPLEVLLSKMTDPNRQYSTQVFRFEESIHVLLSQANFSLNFHFQLSIVKQTPLRLITTGANSTMNQSKFVAIPCNLLKAREKSRLQVAIGFGFSFHLLTNRRKTFKPVTKRCNWNRVITFDSHLKTAVSANI